MVDTAPVDKPVRPVRRRTRASATPRAVVPLTRAERVAGGKGARAEVPLASHAQLDLPDGRDPLGLLLSQAESRAQELVPIRHGRMLVSAFTFFRGAALPMAADLASTPTSPLRVQLCGDAHLANFGAFGSPERKLVFDLNDFDETLPGPFEWDVKRLAASFVVAGRDNGYSRSERRKCVIDVVASYRTAIRDFAQQPMMKVWYAHLDVEDVVKDFGSQVRSKGLKATEGWLAKARTQDSMRALSKLTTMEGGRRQIISDPPLVVPLDELFSKQRAGQISRQLQGLIAAYRENLQSDRQHLLDQFQFVQAARKVVGVGSVGTRAWILLMDGGDGADPLFLQAKEAQRSVLADFVGGSVYPNEGQRVVAGQHLMQASSDIFLGWQSTRGVDGVARDYYVRQLRDWKFSVPLDQLRPRGMRVYAKLCGWTLARAHARSGDRIALAAYLGRSDKFDNAIADFAESYADQNERDHAQLAEAVASGRVEAQSEL